MRHHQRSGNSPLKIVGIAGLVIALIAFAIWHFVFRTEGEPAQIDGFSWERQINWENEITRTRSGWHPPAGARILSRQRRVYSRDEDGLPTYRTYYRYEVDVWEVVERFTSNNADQEPFWPESRTPEHRKEREGRRSETYNVHFQTETNEQHTVRFPQTEWSELQSGREAILHINRLGQVRDLTWVQAEGPVFVPLD